MANSFSIHDKTYALAKHVELLLWRNASYVAPTLQDPILVGAIFSRRIWAILQEEWNINRAYSIIERITRSLETKWGEHQA